jgi:hypothetical protein
VHEKTTGPGIAPAGCQELVGQFENEHRRAPQRAINTPEQNLIVLDETQC